MNVQIKKISITESGCDCVVNAANSSLLEGGGVCGAVFRSAGNRRLQEACNKIGHCKTGDAVITPGFKLAKYIIHAVGPVYHDGKHNESELLYSAYQNSLNLAYANKCESVAFPLISAGIYNYPKNEAFDIALKSVKDWCDKHENVQMNVVFTILDDEIISIGNRCMEKYFQKDNL